MNGTSSGSGLQARLQKRAEQERQEIEALTQSELKKLAKNLRQSVQRRDVYHRARYQGSHPVDERGAVATVAAERDGRGVSLSRHLGRELGPDAVVCQPNPEPHRDEGRAPGGDQRGNASTVERLEGDDVGRGSPRGQSRGGSFVVLPKGTLGLSALDRGWDGLPCRLSSE